VSSHRRQTLPRKGSYLSPVDEKSIGERLREIRLRRGFTQVQIAKKLSVDQAMVSSYERGTARMHGAIIAAFAKAYAVSADEILGLKRPKVDSSYRERRFFRRLREVEKLPRRKKEALISLIDTYIKGQKMQDSA